MRLNKLKFLFRYRNKLLIITNKLLMSKLLKMFGRETSKKTMLLGRWSTIFTDSEYENKNSDSITFNIDSANHDHCGSEICKSVAVKETKKKDKKNFNMTESDMYPYII